MMSRKLLYESFLTELKKINSDKIIVVDPKAEIKHLEEQSKRFTKPDKSNFINIFDLRGDNNA